MTIDVAPRQLARMRLAAHGLLAGRVDAGAGPADVVRRMTAMQAQDLAAVLWAVGRRTPGAGRSAVEQALNAGEIVRSWPMRGTLHLVAPEDLRWMLDLGGPRTLRGMGTRFRQLGIGPGDLSAAAESAVALLAGSRAASRRTLFDAFEAAGQSTGGQRGIHLLAALCLQGLLVQGPLERDGQLLVLFDEWIRASRALEHDEALAEFALRYFRSHGPATETDLAWWTKLPLTEVRRGIRAAAKGLASFETGARTYWIAAEAEALLGAAPGARSLLALPAFDEFLLGYADRTAALPAAHAEKIVPGGNGVFKPVIVAGGSIVGTWRTKASAAGLAVVPVPFEEFSPGRRAAFEREAERYRRFLSG